MHILFQYAVKFVCGKSDGQALAPGVYYTAINVHNPTYKDIAFRKKVAITLPSEPFAYITNFNDNNVSVVDTASNTVTATISVGFGPFGIAVTPNGAFVYVTNQTSNTVSVVDTASNTVTATIPVGSTSLSPPMALSCMWGTRMTTMSRSSTRPRIQ